MICPKCQGNTSDKPKHCERCGADLTVYKKVIRTSNLYYNDGLAKAKVRDLSGAIIALKKSLELNKTNSSARNLLGLVYFEMGETVAALSEWVISKHFDSTDADEYINAVQSNPTKLEGLNQAIKRYNAALHYAKQESEDLAIIQLKKVVSLNPHFLRAYHLLALLYMKSGDNDRAKKCLVRASKIDVSNTTTLRYLKELEPQAIGIQEEEGYSDSNVNRPSSIMPVSAYREDKPNIIAYINLVIGVLVGLAVMAILVIPSIKKNQTTGQNQNYVDYSAGLASLEAKDATITSLQQDKADLEEELTKLQAQIDGIEIPEDHSDLYDPLFNVTGIYMNEMLKDENDREFTGIADALITIDMTKYESDEALGLYNRLKDEIYPIVAEDYYDLGHDKYSAGKYDEALIELQKAYEFNPSDVNAIYFIARTYHRLSDYENASIYYTIVTTDYQDSNRYSDASSYLEQTKTHITDATEAE